MNRRAHHLKAPLFTFALLLSGALAACGELPAEAPTGDVAGTSSAIVNGIEPGPNEPFASSMVAIYHREANASGGAGPWWTRPCSGMIFMQQGNEALVITARHCVTVDGKVDSALVPTSWVKVAAGPAPGPANPNPPSGALNIIFIDAMPVTSAFDYQRDAAILYVYAPWWGGRVDRKGVHMSFPQGGLSFNAYGYGLNSRDNNCYDSAAFFQSSGILRRGELVTNGSGVAVEQAGSFSYSYTNSGPSVICGDSGGPDLGNIAINMPWTVFLGEHVLDDTENLFNTSATTGPWMSQVAGGFYLSPMSSTAKNLIRGSNSIVYVDSIGSAVPLMYDQVAQRIEQAVGGTIECLSITAATSSLALGSCIFGPTKWEITPVGQIRNPTSGKCIRHSTGTLVDAVACPAANATQTERARFTWVWHPKV